MRLKIFMAAAFFCLAALPWLASSCIQQPLMPTELQQAPTRFAATIEAVRTATLAAQRSATSSREVIPIGTLPAPTISDTDNGEEGPLSEGSESQRQSPLSTPVKIVRSSHSEGTAEQASVQIVSSVVISDATILTDTMGSMSQLIVTHTDGLSETTLSPPTALTQSSNGPPRPAGLIPTEDIITNSELMTELTQYAESLSLSNFSVGLTPEGLKGHGIVPIHTNLALPVNIDADFAIENDNLVVKTNAILVDQVDVTTQYQSQFAEHVNSALYQLLPQRYVDDFVLEDGQVTVYSQMKRQ